MSKKLCIYCASSADIADKYKQTAYEIGAICARTGWTLVNGGGSAGLMGATSDGCQQNGGRVVGIIPQFMIDRGWLRDNLDEVIVTTDMAQRKQQLRDKSDAVVVLPGGIGTMEEFFETIVQKQLGLYDKPIILFNQDGYYDHLEAWLNHCHAEQFFRYEGDERLWQCIDSVDALRQLLKDMA